MKRHYLLALIAQSRATQRSGCTLGESVLGCYGCSMIRTSSDLHAVTRFASSFTHAVFSECRNFSCSGVHVGRFAIFYLPDATRQHDDTTEQTIHARVKNRGRRSSSRLTSHPLRRTGFQHSASTDSRAIRTPTESTTESEGELGHGGVRYLRRTSYFPLSLSLFSFHFHYYFVRSSFNQRIRFDVTRHVCTHVGEDGAVVAGLVLVLLVRRTFQNLVSILFVLAVRSLQLEDFHLAGGGMQTRTPRQLGLHLNAKRNAFLATVLLRRKFGTYTINLSTRRRNTSQRTSTVPHREGNVVKWTSVYREEDRTRVVFYG